LALDPSAGNRIVAERTRCYESEQAAKLLEARGLTVAYRGQRFPLDQRRATLAADAVIPVELRRLPGAVGW